MRKFMMAGLVLAVALAPTISIPQTPRALAQELKSMVTIVQGSVQVPLKPITAQKADQFLATKFFGTEVLGFDNTRIGSISNMLLEKDGTIKAYVVMVGGFLGIGAKDVALAPSAFEVIPGDKTKNESDKLKVQMTKDQLKAAQQFEPYKAPRN